MSFGPMINFPLTSKSLVLTSVEKQTWRFEGSICSLIVKEGNVRLWRWKWGRQWAIILVWPFTCFWRWNYSYRLIERNRLLATTGDRLLFAIIYSSQLESKAFDLKVHKSICRSELSNVTIAFCDSNEDFARVKIKLFANREAKNGIFLSAYVLVGNEQTEKNDWNCSFRRFMSTFSLSLSACGLFIESCHKKGSKYFFFAVKFFIVNLASHGLEN